MIRKTQLSRNSNLASLDALQKEITEQITKQVITVVIPTLNEVQAIGRVIDELHEFGYENILVVDGYSTDGTATVAAQKGVRVIDQAGKGKSGALATAIQYVKTRYMLVMDGDCTYDPAYVDKLVAHAVVYDEVIGARTFGRENIPRLNRLGNRLISWFFQLMFSVRLSDVCSGFYLILTDAAKKLEFITGGFDVEVEIAAQFAVDGKVSEVPVNYRPRVGRQKLSSLRHGVTISTSILRLAKSHNPVFLYSACVALTMIPALGIIEWVFYNGIYYGHWSMAYTIIGLVLLMLSLQSLAISTLSLLIKRSEQRADRAMKQITQALAQRELE